MAAQKRLMIELQALQKEKWVHIDVDERNVLMWRIGLMVVNPDSVFHGAYLKAEMTFRADYPIQPPTFRFINRNLYHPNIYSDGKLCISILHNPGEDEQSGEQASERWSPLQGVESVLRSVLLLLDNPEIGSPANVDAGVLYRDKRVDYDNKARETAERSKKDMPPDVRFPTTAELEPVPQKVDDNAAFWQESDEGDDFDSGSDFDMDDDDNEDDNEDDDQVETEYETSKKP
ncbi:Ubiquitin-conjugating enzyme E2-34 kDa [Colletotrichum spinosum]|uniref:Ubiquitin-conjugating enzyme E2 2 n=1 Tax=Colletotrichum spinosum TaxID=1347390 RepID=A0A4R8PL92_9PEZI|nr:Ubiquitin-conjugating enzyme E2-34 kDa [Colletotrichum spinosum]